LPTSRSTSRRSRWRQQKKDVKHAEAIEAFLEEKFTNVELYDLTDLRLRQLLRNALL
jgi:Tc toxin complex TcA C-terminal TcB-binding domain